MATVQAPRLSSNLCTKKELGHKDSTRLTLVFGYTHSLHRKFLSIKETRRGHVCLRFPNCTLDETFVSASSDRRCRFWKFRTAGLGKSDGRGGSPNICNRGSVEQGFVFWRDTKVVYVNTKKYLQLRLRVITTLGSLVQRQVTFPSLGQDGLTLSYVYANKSPRSVPWIGDENQTERVQFSYTSYDSELVLGLLEKIDGKQTLNVITGIEKQEIELGHGSLYSWPLYFRE